MDWITSIATIDNMIEFLLPFSLYIYRTCCFCRLCSFFAAFVCVYIA